MTRFFAPLIAATTVGALSAAIIGCSHSSDNAVPRPTAYPRVEIYDSTYTAVPGSPLHIELSSHASVEVDSSRRSSVWINATYPAYGATLHCTITPASGDASGDVVANRSERMSLNTGGHPTEVTTGNAPSGFASQILVTPAGTITPVQFLSVSPQWVVSGALYLPGADTAPDSVAPIVKAVYRDLVHLTKTIR